MESIIDNLFKKVKTIDTFTCLNKRETKNILNLNSYLNNFHEPERSTRNLMAICYSCKI